MKSVVKKYSYNRILQRTTIIEAIALEHLSNSTLKGLKYLNPIPTEKRVRTPLNITSSSMI